MPIFAKEALIKSQELPYIEYNLMQMFYKSPFYEEKSDNEMFRTQQGNTDLLSYLEDGTGIQFVFIQKRYIVDKKLGWIEKRKRHGPGKQYDVVSVYYVLAQGMDFVVFQAPTLPHIVNTRINNAIFYTKKAFEII